MNIHLRPFHPHLTAIVALLAALALPASAPPLQIEPCVMAIYPQKDFLAVSLMGNISDVRAGMGISDAARKNGDYSDAAVKQANDYLKQNLTLKIGAIPLTGTVTGLS